VGSVAILVAILGLTFYAYHRSRSISNQSRGYVVTPLLNPVSGLQPSVNSILYPPIGPPPSYFDSQATAPAQV
jgi:hypothetical protein